MTLTPHFVRDADSERIRRDSELLSAQIVAAMVQVTDIESTGPVTRVYLSTLGHSDNMEALALDAAKDALGTDALGDVWADKYGYQILFENGDLS